MTSTPSTITTTVSVKATSPLAQVAFFASATSWADASSTSFVIASGHTLGARGAAKGALGVRTNRDILLDPSSDPVSALNYTYTYTQNSFFSEFHTDGVAEEFLVSLCI
jgi:hypothetical protein